MSLDKVVPPRPPSLEGPLLLSFAICLVIVIGLSIFFTPSTAPRFASQDGDHHAWQFAPLEIDVDRLEGARREHHADAQLDRAGDHLTRLHDLVRVANLAQFPSGQSDDTPPPRALQAELSFAADEVITATTLSGFPVAGQAIFEACQTGIEQLLGAIRSKSITLDDARTDPAPRRFQTYRENCGNALSMLLEHRLVTLEGEWAHPQGPKIFEILNRLRWADIIHSRRPARLQLPAYEFEILMRWRIESPDAFPLAKRREFLSQAAQHLGDYDTELARARLDSEGQELSKVLDRFRELTAAHPNRTDYAEHLARLEQHAKGS